MKYIFPDYENSIYNLHYAILDYFGIKNRERGKIKLENKKNKLLFILVDSLGINLLNKLNLKLEYHEMTSVLPSSTPTALPSFFFGLRPSEHMIFIRTKTTKLSGTLLWFPYYYVYPTRSAPIVDITFVYNFDTIFTKLKKKELKSLSIIHNSLENTALTKILYKDSDIKYYLNWFDAVELILENKNYDFIIWYLMDIDDLSHQYSIDHPSILLALKYLFELIEYIKEKDVFDIIISADHGQTKVNKMRLLEELQNNPNVERIYGDRRAIMIDGELEEINKIFPEDDYFVFYKEEAFKLLGGRGNKKIMTDYLIVPKNGEEMRMRLGFDDKPESEFKSAHGGLTEDEQKIPLITF